MLALGSLTAVGLPAIVAVQHHQVDHALVSFTYVRSRSVCTVAWCDVARTEPSTCPDRCLARRQEHMYR